MDFCGIKKYCKEVNTTLFHSSIDFVIHYVFLSLGSLKNEYLRERNVYKMKNQTTYFKNPETLEELKKQYRELAFKHHPDKGGSDETMKEINSNYDTLFQQLKNIHRNKDGEVYTSKQTVNETSEQFRDIINELMRMDDIVIVIIGCFIWVTGNTKKYKDTLKKLNLKWHSKKLAWYLKPEDYVQRSHKNYDLEEIRKMYGTNGTVNSTGTDKLTAYETRK